MISCLISLRENNKAGVKNSVKKSGPGRDGERNL